jgi:tetratricopeptide (TPR) repeat protein
LAVPHLERAFALRTLHLGADHPDTLAAENALAGNYAWLGRYDEAIALDVHVLEARRAALGPDHIEVLACVYNLAGAYSTAGRWDVSTTLLESMIERAQAVGGPTHPVALNAMHALAMNYADMDRLAESTALYEKLLRLNESAVWPLKTFAQACQKAGQLDRAEQLLRDALEIELKRPDSRRHRMAIANTRGWQAVNLLLREKYAEAEPLAREVVAAYGAQCSDDHRYFYWMSVHGAALCGLGRYAEAEPLLLRGYEGQKERAAIMPATELPRMTEAGQRLVVFYRLTQQPEKAQAWLDRFAVTRDRE